MARIDSAYSYYLSTYADKRTTTSRSNTHKKSELRSVYNDILKEAKDSPLYKIDFSGDATHFAIDVKEHARDIQDVIESMSLKGDDVSSIMTQKIAVSSNEDVVSVDYIGSDDDSDVASFELEVSSLASPQINIGNFLKPHSYDFEEGTFSFDLDTNSNSYEFQFNVIRGDDNDTVQQRVARLVNSSDVGLKADLIKDDKGNQALRLTSKQTGLAENEEYLFDIHSSKSWNEVKTLGIGQVSAPAANSSFTLNGKEHSSLSNSFTINKNFEIHLLGTNIPGETTTIGFKADVDAVADKVEDLVNAYNGMVTVGQSYSDGHSSSQLFNDITAVPRAMSTNLNDIGLNIDDSGMMSIDKDILSDALTKDQKATTSTLNRFKSALSRKADKASINPMQFVDKLLVEYKNPGKSLTPIYATSAFAGLLVDKSL